MKLYMNKVVFEEEKEACDGVTAYPSIQTLKDADPNTEECGIVEVEIVLSKVILQGKY